MILLIAGSALLMAIVSDRESMPLSDARLKGRTQLHDPDRPTRDYAGNRWFWNNYMLHGAPTHLLAWRLYRKLSIKEAVAMSGISHAQWNGIETSMGRLGAVNQGTRIASPENASKIEKLTGIPAQSWVIDPVRHREWLEYGAIYGWPQNMGTPPIDERLKTILKEEVSWWSAPSPIKVEPPPPSVRVFPKGWWSSDPKTHWLARAEGLSTRRLSKEELSPPQEQLIPSQPQFLHVRQVVPEPGELEMEESLEQHRDSDWPIDWA